MAYAAVLSLTHILEHTLNHDYQYLILNEKQQILSLLETVSSLQDFLENSTQKSCETIECLEGRIRNAAYLAEDIIESHITDRVVSESASHWDESFCQNLKEVIEEIDTIKKQAMKIEDGSGKKDLQALTSLPSAGASKHASSGTSTTMGLHDDLMNIKERLTSGSSEFETVAIVGMGGIGKSTLAREVYNDAFILYYFHIRAWVKVSQNYNVREILLNLLDSMKKLTDKMHEESTEQLAELLYRNLKGMRYFIVMDDVWDVKVWDDVRRSFPNDKNGSRFMMTTRLENVADYANSRPPLHRMRFLNEDESWNLFREKVFGKYSCPLELEEIGRKIVQNCRGLPLAIVVIGGLLSKATKTQNYWKNVAENLSSVITSNDYQYSKILSLSYNHLPYHLKWCFLYMGVFLQDFNIHVSDLVKLWVAEGILKPISSKSLEDVAQENLLDLVERSLVLVCKQGSNGKIKTCMIHDLLRDLCLREAQRKKFFHVTDGNLKGPHSSMRRVCIHLNRNILHDDEESLPTFLVRSFLQYEHLRLPLNVSDFWLLRVLHTIQAGYINLPKEVTELVNLRYLSGRCNKRWPLASIWKLRNLQTLILDRSFSFYPQVWPFSIPRKIWRMSQLRHVQLDGAFLPDPPTTRIPEENSIIVLENLLTLSTIINFRCTEEMLKRIPNLKKLGIFYGNKLGALADWQYYSLNNLARLHKLEVLKCHIVRPKPHFLHSLILPHSLKKLTLNGGRFPWEDMTIVGSSPNLQVLKLKHYAFKGPKWESNEGEFLQLKFFLIEEIDLKHWIADHIHFPSLQHLVIKECTCLEELPCGIGDIPTLESIELHNCADSLVTSATEIQEEQQNLGNDGLKVLVRGKYEKF
ncbi:Disease resistance protein RPP13 [Forsythia ovata]|uniref:Disease resistance protein RPP13 n=1 Tax=Forsythia ovata TaxID=205694 RepID=A0ABD1TT87_9LAMI